MGLGAFRQLKKETSGDQGTLAGLQNDGPVEVGAEVHACAVGGGVGGERVAALVGDADGEWFRGCGDHAGKGRHALHLEL